MLIFLYPKTNALLHLCPAKSKFMLKLRKLFFTALAVCLGMMVNAQVTTSSISGSVKDQSGKLLEGAAITATHLPSGTS